MPCPVRVPLLDAFNKWMEEEGSKLDYIVDYELKAAAGGIDWLIDNIKKMQNQKMNYQIYLFQQVLICSLIRH